MKKLYFFSMLIFSLQFSVLGKEGSETNVGTSKWTGGFNLNLLDFYSPRMDGFKPFKYPTGFGPQLSAWRNFGGTGLALDLNTTIPFGTTNIEKNGTYPNVNRYLLFAGAGLVYKFTNDYMLKPTSMFAPYIFANAAGSYARVNGDKDNKKFGFGIPVGAGLNIRMGEGVAFNVKGGYTFGLTDYFQDHVMLGAGIMADLNRKKEAPTPIAIPAPAPEPDTDGDGIVDKDDECPSEAGLATLNGCPDKDGDGIADAKDACPEIAGLAIYSGCPDTDGDGVADNLDKCPKEAGLVRLQGCPEPDSDKDGIIDVEDRCPNEAGTLAFKGCPDTDGDGLADIDDKCPKKVGPISNQGCPEVKAEVKKRLDFAASAIKFESGKATLKPESYKILDEVVAIMKEYDDYKVSVNGYTDNTGKPELNQTLSEQRAKVCADYLISKGIDASRVSSAGFGSSNPIADNKTPAGRALNRRTEFKLTLK